MRLPTEQQYRDALTLVGIYWRSGGRMDMTPAIAKAYRIVGRYTHEHFAPKSRVPHPRKSAIYRLRSNFRPSPPLTRNMKIVTRVARTGSRTWSEVWLEIIDQKLGCVYRYRHGLGQPMVEIRALHRGGPSRSRPFTPCRWRPLTKLELARLPTQAAQFLQAMGSSVAGDRRR